MCDLLFYSIKVTLIIDTSHWMYLKIWITILDFVTIPKSFTIMFLGSWWRFTTKNIHGQQENFQTKNSQNEKKKCFNVNISQVWQRESPFRVHNTLTSCTKPRKCSSAMTHPNDPQSLAEEEFLIILPDSMIVVVTRKDRYSQQPGSKFSISLSRLLPGRAHFTASHLNMFYTPTKLVFLERGGRKRKYNSMFPYFEFQNLQTLNLSE